MRPHTFAGALTRDDPARAICSQTIGAAAPVNQGEPAISKGRVGRSVRSVPGKAEKVPGDRATPFDLTVVKRPSFENSPIALNGDIPRRKERIGRYGDLGGFFGGNDRTRLRQDEARTDSKEKHGDQATLPHGMAYLHVWLPEWTCLTRELELESAGVNGSWPIEWTAPHRISQVLEVERRGVFQVAGGTWW